MVLRLCELHSKIYLKGEREKRNTTREQKDKCFQVRRKERSENEGVKEKGGMKEEER